MGSTERFTAGLTVATGDRLRDELVSTPLGSRWRSTAPNGGDAEVVLIAPLRDDLPYPEARRHFEGAAALQHPQLRPVRRAVLEHSVAVVAYDPAEGPSLAQWLGREAPQGIESLSRVRDLFEGVCQGVAVVHRAGLVHGDLAPWNLQMVTRGAQVIPRLDAVGAALLAPLRGVDRLAPELDPRAFGSSPRADVFALGLLLGTLLLGDEVPPAHVPQRLDAQRPELDDSLRALVRACLGADPESRPADATKVRELVRRAVWSPRTLPAPPAPPARLAVRASEPVLARAAEPVLARAAEPGSAPLPPPVVFAPTPPTAVPTLPPASEVSPPLDDPTIAVRIPPADLPDAPEPTAFVTILPATDAPSTEYAATLRTPPRRQRPEVPSPTIVPASAFEPVPDDLWGYPQDSFHSISLAPPAPPGTAPTFVHAPAVPAPATPARPRPVLLAGAILAMLVLLCAALVAWTR